jgi:hypothetical protein
MGASRVLKKSIFGRAPSEIRNAASVQHCTLPKSQKGHVAGELLFGATTGHVTLRLNTRLLGPYVHPLNVADFKGIRAG